VQGSKYVVLFFYPLDFTFVCPTEITAFSDRYAEFAKLNTEVGAGRYLPLPPYVYATPGDGLTRPSRAPAAADRSAATSHAPPALPHIAPAQVLGVSVDSQFSHLAWIQTGELSPGWWPCVLVALCAGD
jgi:hypothetical protein